MASAGLAKRRDAVGARQRRAPKAPLAPRRQGSSSSPPKSRTTRKNSCVVLVAVIDNLVKGAAGSAVQNLNVLLGLDERTGLL